jgi:gluconate 2-dehydrogenase
MQARQHVVVYKALPPALLARLRDEFDLTCFERIDAGNHALFAQAIQSADGLLGASVPIGPALLAGAHRLKVISTISAGVDQFDVDDLTRRGIVLAHTPDALTETTADTIFMLLMMAARRAVELADFIRSGAWTHSIDEALFGMNVHAKTLGIIGMGRIGRALARRAHAGFGMKLLYANRSAAPDVEAAFEARAVPLDKLLSEADFVCVTLPLTPETTQLIGAREFALMRPDAIFVNGSRGRVVDEAALVDALQQGRLRAAGLDVFEREPLPADSPLLKLRNVVALPHIGSATHETRMAMAQTAIDNLVAALRGERPRFVANEAVLQRTYR